MKRIYLDHAATTPLDGEVLRAMTPYLTDIYGNASSQHGYGREAANALVAARDEIAGMLGVESNRLYFTSGGTESGNTALKGVCSAYRDRGAHIVISAIEHPSLLEAARDMERYGYRVTYVKPDGEGIVHPEDVARAICGETVFVGVMAANNETGVIQPVKEIYSVCRDRNVFFYCDCVQVAGVKQMAQFAADGIGFSSHKFYGPKGFGGLYVGGNWHFDRLLSGGEQESGRRGGTQDVASAVGCAHALKLAYAHREENNARVKALRDRFVQRVLREIDGTCLNGSAEHRLPSNANISFDGCDGEQILFALDLKGIAVSTGSACSSGAAAPSHVLTAMGLDAKRVKGAVRFSFGKGNTSEEVDIAVDALKRVVGRIRGN